MRSTTLALLLLFGCAGGADQPESSPPGEATEAADETADEAPAKPRTAAVTPTDDGALGTLPEGVGVPVGSPAPDAEVRALDGETLSLAELYDDGPVLVLFYRGGWCPYCNHQLRELSMAWPRFEQRGVQIAAISVDRPDAATKTAQSWEIPFVIASDADLAAHRAWRMERQLDDAGVARLAELGIDVEAASGRDHHTIAIPGLFLVVDGTVRWAHADTDYKVRPSPAQILAAIDRAGS